MLETYNVDLFNKDCHASLNNPMSCIEHRGSVEYKSLLQGQQDCRVCLYNPRN
jgi:hypothetical protein